MSERKPINVPLALAVMLIVTVLLVWLVMAGQP